MGMTDLCAQGTGVAPQQPAQFAAILGQTFATALRLEEMLIPEDALKRWLDRVPLPTNVDHVVAGVRAVVLLSYVKNNSSERRQVFLDYGYHLPDEVPYQRLSDRREEAIRSDIAHSASPAFWEDRPGPPPDLDREP
jgi:hypothetical protein